MYLDYLKEILTMINYVTYEGKKTQLDKAEFYMLISRCNKIAKKCKQLRKTEVGKEILRKAGL